MGSSDLVLHWNSLCILCGSDQKAIFGHFAFSFVYAIFCMVRGRKFVVRSLLFNTNIGRDFRDNNNSFEHTFSFAEFGDFILINKH